MDQFIKRKDAFEILQSRLDGISQMSYLNMDWHELEIMRDAIEHAIDDVGEVPSADVQSVKHGRWLNHHAIWIDQPKVEGWFVQAKCSECEKWAHVMNPYTKSVDYECCPHCAAKMDLDGVTPTICSNYMDGDGSCYIDDNPCECDGNIEKCKG